MRHRGWRASLVAMGLVAGCAYYNGLYNANRLVGDAKRAEREGRAGEARSLWAQAAVKAESVATRYTTSRHWDDALLLWGEGLLRAGDCRRASPPLALAVDSSRDATIQQRSRLLLAECRLDLRDAPGAIAAVEPLLGDEDSTVANEARYIRGQAYLRLGDATAAVEDLRGVSSETGAFALARAYIALDDLPSAQAILEERVPGGYAESEWLPVLQALGVRAPARASAIVDLLVQRLDLAPGQRGRLLLADGGRWFGAGESARAMERYSAVATIAADSVEGSAARAHLAYAELRAMDDLADFPAVDEKLREAAQGAGQARAIIGPAMEASRIARETLDSPVERPGRDLRLFLLGELFRDSLRAPVPATRIFLRLSADHPVSIVAPKALLAAAYLDPSRSDSIGRVLEGRYPTSPYTLALRGQGAAAFLAAEDSLRTVLAMTNLRDAQQQEQEAGARDRRTREQ